MKKLGGICDKIGSGKTPKGGVEVYQDAGIPFIRSQNVLNNALVLDTTHISENIHESMKSSKVLANDILLNITGGSIGRSCVVPSDFKEGNVNQHVAIIRPKKDDSAFLQAILSSSRGQKLIFQGQTGSGREGLNFESIKGFKIHFPKIQEQQKISSFLTLIDERIQTQRKIIDQLETLMRGLREKLFKQKIRFKDEKGNDYPEWVKLNFKQVAVVQMGQSPDSKSYNNLTIGIPLIQGNADIQNRLSRPRQWTNEPTKICEVGDLILTVRAPVGIVSKSVHKACIGRGVCSIKNKSNSDIDFLYQFLIWYEVRWQRLEQGSTFTSVSGRDINNLSLWNPSLREQTRIAKFLSSFDEKIDSEKQLLAQYTLQKKYLLQNLFV